MILFAETSDSVTAILMVISGLVGSGASWFVTYLTNKHERQRKEQKEDEKTIVDHLTEVERRCNQENKELKAELKETNKQLIRVMNHIMYLEGILDSKGVKFRRFEVDQDSGSGTHSILVENNSNPLPKPESDKDAKGKG